ncbi:MAG: efflux RND transporter periplasmic adaptor subunit [Acetobacteraceae bacterium]
MLAAPKSVTIHFTAYAQVQPITVFRIRTAMAGVLAGLKVVPGTKVGAGTTLARLGGPAIEAASAARQAAVAGAKAAVVAAQKSLATQSQQRTLRLATREAVYQAKSALIEAQARLETAQSQLRAFRSEAAFQSPQAGQVLVVNAADGERVQPGQVILTIQPANDLWLKASFYGANAAAIQPGMRGHFQPADGGAAIPVTVRSRIGTLQPDGGLIVGLAAATASPAWQNGESGALTLDGPTLTEAAVPTRALVLDQGRWWVLVRTPHGDRRQAVVPGPSRGDLTLIRHGLAAGAEVVVENAYLAFHHNFSQSYQPPD